MIEPPGEELAPVEAYMDEPAAVAAEATPSSKVLRIRPDVQASCASEPAVVGGLLLGGDYSSIAHIVRPEDYSPQNRLILQAICTLVSNGSSHDPLTVSQQLERTKHLVGAGGLAYLIQLAHETLGFSNLYDYAKAVREHALMRTLPAVYHDPRHLDRLRRDLGELERLSAPPARPTVVLRHVADLIDERRECEWLNGLEDILERCVVALIAGPRSSFKSFVALHWLLQAAMNGEPGVALSGEGGGFGRRVEGWLKSCAPTKRPRDLPLLVLERAINLNAEQSMSDLCAAIDAVPMTPSLVLIDTLSKFTPGLKENAQEEIGAFLNLVSARLREHYGCTVLLVAHTGHGDGKRPRGSSLLMCNPDAEFIVTRPAPTDMSATVTRERFKDSAALSPLAYSAEVIDLGRLDRRGGSVTTLVMRDADPNAVSVPQGRKEPSGKSQRQLLAALRAEPPGTVWTLPEMREIGRKAGLQKSTARSAVDSLTFTPHMIATVGGWRLSDG